MMLDIEMCMFEHPKYSTCWMELIIRKHIQRARESYIWGETGLGKWMVNVNALGKVRLLRVNKLVYFV